MLDKNYIIKMLNDLNLPPSEYWITSGSALVMHGVKQYTKDIDLGCTNSLWDFFLQNGHMFRVGKDNSKIMQINEYVEVIKEYHVEEIEFVEGLPTGSLKSIKKQKERLGREKDIIDIRLIDEYIKKIDA
ncbi:hypothetical protein [Clostridium intestinale]|uniref:hypothetical protein n=1 Tax=Clostridium intestinale TaxID=36845 RepID=UPI002DD63CA5|nr:hypothetical protein [Clostridium intestinale]WRY52237.1 hypothetical protein P8F83_03370 [Clostridium intestinale]